MKLPLKPVLLILVATLASSATADLDGVSAGVGGSEAVRIGIIDKGGAGDVLSLLEVALSEQPGLELLDRTRVAAVSAEWGMQAYLSEADQHQAGAMLGADGIILLHRNDDGLIASLMSVVAGSRLALHVMPADEDRTLADAVTDLASVFTPSFRKLQGIASEDVIPLSVLGVFFSLSTAEALLLERDINTRLSVRFSRIENVMMLERWNLSRLKWDQALTAVAGNTFWQGAYLLDGVIHDRDGGWEVTVRLKGPDASDQQQSTFEVADQDIDQLVAGVERVLINMLPLRTPSGEWDALEEANHFIRLAQAAIDRKQYDTGIGLAESAFMMGYRSAYAADMLMYAYHNNPNKGATFGDRLAYEIHTKSFYLDYLSNERKLYTRDADGNRVDADTAGLPNARPYRLGGMLQHFHNSPGGVLQYAHREHKQMQYRAELDQLRNLLQQTARLIRPMPHESGQRKRFDFTHNRNAIPYVTRTPEEALEAYEYVLYTLPRLASTSSGQDRLHKFRCDRRGHEPWLIAWDPADEERLPDLWTTFINNLYESDCLARKGDGLALRFIQLEDENDRLAMLPEIVAFLRKHREAVVDNSRDPYPQAFSDILSRYGTRMSQDDRKLLFEYVLAIAEYAPDLANRQAQFSFHMNSIDGLGRGWDLSQAIELYKKAKAQLDALAGLRHQDLSFHEQLSRNGRLHGMAVLHRDLLIDHPELTRILETVPLRLHVARMHPLPYQSFLKDAGGVPRVGTVRTLNERLFFNVHFESKEPSRVITFDTETREAVQLMINGKPAHRLLAIDDHSLWCDDLDEPRARWHRKHNEEKWKKIILPDYSYTDAIVYIEGVVYVGLDDPDVGRGILRYDLATDAHDIMISSLRRTGEHDLDGVEINVPAKLYVGEEGTLIMQEPRPMYYRYALPLGATSYELIRIPPGDEFRRQWGVAWNLRLSSEVVHNGYLWGIVTGPYRNDNIYGLQNNYILWQRDEDSPRVAMPHSLVLSHELTHLLKDGWQKGLFAGRERRLRELIRHPELQAWHLACAGDSVFLIPREAYGIWEIPIPDAVAFAETMLKQETGIVSLRSNPRDATIMIDGIPHGLTPLQLTLPVGQYDIVLEKKGFVSRSLLVKVQQGRVVDLETLQLKQLPLRKE